MPARTLLIAMDGAVATLLSQWAGTGALPTLGRMMAEGFSAPLQGPSGFGDAATWATVHTGLTPAQHGRYSYRQFRKGTYQKALSGARDLKAEPFWNAPSHAGRRIAILDIPKSPLPTDLNGVFLGDWLVHGRDYPAPVGFPAGFERDIIDRFGPAPPSLCGLNQPKLDSDGYDLMMQRLHQAVRMKRDMAISVLDRENWDLLATGFKACHCVGHHAWHLHDPGHPDHDPGLMTRSGDPLLEIYQAVDEAIAALMRRAGPDATTIVFSPLGMGPHYGAFALLPDILGGLGYAGNLFIRSGRAALKALAGPPRSSGGGTGSGGKPPHPRLRNRVREWFDARRTCLSIDLSEHVTGLRINLQGREPRGLIAPGADQTAFEVRLAADLLDLTDAQSGQPIIDRIVVTREAYEGPFLDELPDLLVFWNMTQPVSAVTSPKLGTVRASGTKRRTGAHRDGGMLFATGPGIPNLALQEPVDIRQLAPTIMRRLGVLPTPDMMPPIPGLDQAAVMP